MSVMSLPVSGTVLVGLRPARRVVARRRAAVVVPALVVGSTVPAWLAEEYRGEPWFPVLARLSRNEIAMALLASGVDPRALLGLRRLNGLDAHIGVALRGLERVGEQACRRGAAGLREIQARYGQAMCESVPGWRKALNTEVHHLLSPLLGGVPVRDNARRDWAWYEAGTIVACGFEHDAGRVFAETGRCPSPLCRHCYPQNFREDYDWEFAQRLDAATPAQFRAGAAR